VASLAEAEGRAEAEARRGAARTIRSGRAGGRPALDLFCSDQKQGVGVKLQDAREDSTVAVDFQLLGKREDRASTRVHLNQVRHPDLGGSTIFLWLGVPYRRNEGHTSRRGRRGRRQR